MYMYFTHWEPFRGIQVYLQIPKFKNHLSFSVISICPNWTYRVITLHHILNWFCHWQISLQILILIEKMVVWIEFGCLYFICISSAFLLAFCFYQDSFYLRLFILMVKFYLFVIFVSIYISAISVILLNCRYVQMRNGSLFTFHLGLGNAVILGFVHSW